MSVELDFVLIEEKINSIVIAITSILYGIQGLNLEESKNITREFSDNYSDYHDTIFIFISTLISKIKAGDIENFIFLFLAGTFLLKPFLIFNSDSLKINRVNEIILDLYDFFNELY